MCMLINVGISDQRPVALAHDTLKDYPLLKYIFRAPFREIRWHTRSESEVNLRERGPSADGNMHHPANASHVPLPKAEE